MKSGKLILLVDDDPISNYLHRRLLNSLHLKVEIEAIKECFNGKEAIEFICRLHKLDKKIPDLIFLDINMPMMDGYEFLKAFNEMPIPQKDKIKIILLSTSSDISRIENTECQGIDIIEKPLTEEKLKDILIP